MNDRCLHGYVSGRVQGVSFRAFVRSEALAAGVSGWAKNLPDGRVEVLLCGGDAAVQRVVAALHRGPPLAEVAAVVLAAVDDPAPQGFAIG
jgi:acylphosphatase